MVGVGHWWWNRGLGRKESAGYTTVKGQVLNGDQLWTLMEGLEANDLLHYTHLLTGAKFISLSNLLNLCFPGFIAAFYISLISSYSIHIAFFLHSRVNIRVSQNSWIGSGFWPILDIFMMIRSVKVVSKPPVWGAFKSLPWNSFLYSCLLA